MSGVVKPRRLAAGPVGAVCVISAMALIGLWTTVLAAWTAAGLLIIAGLWCLRPVDEPKPGRIVYEETQQ